MIKKLDPSFDDINQEVKNSSRNSKKICPQFVSLFSCISSIPIDFPGFEMFNFMVIFSFLVALVMCTYGTSWVLYVKIF